MNSPSVASPSLGFVRTGLTLLGFAAVTCAADGSNNDQRVREMMRTAPSAGATSAEQSSCAGQTPSHALPLEGAHGEQFALVYSPGCGWKYVAAGADVSGQAPAAAPTSALVGKPVAGESSPISAEDPMAVFIDGPTGYTFCWTRSGGWKFAGHVAAAGKR